MGMVAAMGTGAAMDMVVATGTGVAGIAKGSILDE